MRVIQRNGPAWKWVSLGLLALLAPMVRADQPSGLTTTGGAASPTPLEAPADSALARALEMERKQDWSSAIRIYEEALEASPGRSDLFHRMRLCETHLKISRRYQDQSFRQVLLKLTLDKALQVYDEMLDRIEHHYVDPVAFEPMVRRGLDNLEVALRDPTFLKLNAKGYDVERVMTLRKMLRLRRDAISVADRAGSRAEVVAVCEVAREGLNLNPAAVVLEFVFGACEVLDTYTMYLTPDKLDDMFAMIDGNFVGLGVELKADPKGLKIVGVIRGGPASEAGMKVNDVILAVDSIALRGLGLDDAANRLQGEEGSKVAIEVASKDALPRTLKLTRRHVEVESVAQAKFVDPNAGIGYIQLTTFQKSSADELDRAIRKLEREGMKYLVLDLRGNPGGLLNVAVEIADRFVDRGVIVSTKGRAPGQTQVYRARPDKPYTMPLAVLIDRESASASEILAGALKDLNRAIVLGDRSYGKGSVQSIYEMRAIRAGLKLTTAQFYSPTSRPYTEQGVSPDVLVRGAARPASRRGDPDDNAPAFTFGDPTADPVLMLAVERAKRPVAAR